MRLDMELVHRNMFESRSKAQASIKSGIIYCDQQKITKSSYDVNSDTQIEIRGEVLPYVSRAGLKLEKALEVFSISLDGKTMVDIGSSTGGFTDCALSHHIKKVIAVDVGSNQLHPKLRNHPQVELYEQTDFRDIDLDILKDVSIATIDVSFISVSMLMKKLSEISSLKEVVCLIKPQFECGKEIASKYRGVITSHKVHEDVICQVKNYFSNISFRCVGITKSPIKGGSGNLEFLGYFVKQ